MSPLAFTSCAPKEWKIAPAVSTLSDVVPRPMPKGKPALWQASAALSEGVERPRIGLGRCAGRIHRLNVDAGMLLHEIDARAGSLDLAADGRRHGEPLAIDLAEILDGTVHGTVLLDQRLDDVVHRHELVGVARRQPGREGQHVVAGLGLRFGGGREQELVALRRDVVDRDFDLLLVGPFLDQASLVLLAPGTQWSQRPSESLPAA